jgi:hypothetical protein
VPLDAAAGHRHDERGYRRWVGTWRGVVGGGLVDDDLVLVEHDGALLIGTVLWRYEESGRMRALVRYETPSGVVVRRLHWADELWPTSEPPGDDLEPRPQGRVLELDLRPIDQPRPGTAR